MGTLSDEAAPRARSVGRYTLGGVVASGGMASIHLGQMRGAAGFSRTVAIKRMHAHFASDPDFASMFTDEARLAARVRHPNVVPTLDVVMQGTDLFIVMDYVQGATLAQLARLAAQRGERIPPPIALAIARGALLGLHAAHDAVDAEGRPLGIVHRDVSPQNIIVGVDGVARVLDFGVAKANVRLHQTREGGLKGKLAYMAPEQLEGAAVDRASDVFAASVVLWEALTGARLYAGANEGEIVAKLLRDTPRAPSSVAPELGTTYDALLARGLTRDPAKRFATAREMALALVEVGDVASEAETGAWVERIAAEPLAERASRVRALETALHRGGSDVEPPEADPDETRPATPASMVLPQRPPARRARARVSAAIGIGALGGLAAVAFVFLGGPSASPAAPSVASSVAIGAVAISGPVMARAALSSMAVAPPPASTSASGPAERGTPPAPPPARARAAATSTSTTTRPAPTAPARIPDHL